MSDASGPSEERPGAEEATSAFVKMARSSDEAPGGHERDRAEGVERALGSRALGAARDERKKRGRRSAGQVEENLEGIDGNGVDAEGCLRGKHRHEDLVDTKVQIVRHAPDPSAQAKT